jgi:transposase
LPGAGAVHHINSRPTSSGTGRDTYPKSYAPHGYDAGKKLKGKKRHILLDTLGLLLHTIVHRAHIQDRDGGILVMATLFGMFPFLKTLFADGGSQGPQFAKALAKVLPHLDVKIKRFDQTKGFVVLPRRWIVERTIAWLNRCRRLAKDWENQNRKALAFLRLNPPHASKTL